MSNIETSSLYDYVKKIQKLSVEDQLKLIELISINLVKNFHIPEDIAEENQDDDQISFPGDGRITGVRMKLFQRFVLNGKRISDPKRQDYDGLKD